MKPLGVTTQEGRVSPIQGCRRQQHNEAVREQRSKVTGSARTRCCQRLLDGAHQAFTASVGALPSAGDKCMPACAHLQFACVQRGTPPFRRSAIPAALREGDACAVLLHLYSRWSNQINHACSCIFDYTNAQL